MKKQLALFGLAVPLLAAPAIAQVPPTGREVMETHKMQDRTQDTEAEIRMTIISARGGTRERDIVMWTKTRSDDTQMQLIRFQSPADVEGTGFLSIENLGREDDNWLYLPALRKTRRIAGADKRDSFVGTDFSFEDLEPERLDSYEYRLAGSEIVEKSETWVVEATPTDPKKIEETAYGGRQLWIDKKNGVMRRSEFYGRDGTFLKRLNAEDVRPVPGTDKWRAYRLTMEDILGGSRTVLEISSYHIDEGVPEEYFTQRYLRRR